MGALVPLTGQVLFIILIGLPIYFYYQAKAKWKGFGTGTLKPASGWCFICWYHDGHFLFGQ
nr:hypothetical protein P5665_03795 [Bacillus subtilis]